jgi:hypothetical protein
MKTQQSVLQTSVVAYKVSLGTLKSGANPPIDVCHNFEGADAELQYLREYSGCFGSFGCSGITFLFREKSFGLEINVVFLDLRHMHIHASLA